MHDINFVRANLDVVRQKLAQRNFAVAALDRFSELDERRRTLIRDRDELKSTRNKESQEIGKLMKAGQREEAEKRGAAVRQLGERIPEIEKALETTETDLHTLLATLPNLPHESIPVGADESANQEVKRWGEPPRFSFAPRDHVDIGTALRYSRP